MPSGISGRLVSQLVKTEIIAVGTELLLGQIVDTNSSWMGEQLALAGLDSHYQTKVGDNFDRIEASLRLALDRSDAVIVCGGLGPTPDDITRDVLASVMGVELVFQESIAERIRAMFASRNRAMPENNLRQAMVPEGATPIPQQPGTAPGLIAPIRWVPGVGPVSVDGQSDGLSDWPSGSPSSNNAQAAHRVVYLVPGVPSEMRAMLHGTVLADLQRRAGVSAAIESRVLRTWGQSESGLAEMLAGRIDELEETANPTLAFLASGIEGIKVRITAKASDSAEALKLINAEQAVLEPLLGDLIFAYDDDTMETAVLTQLKRLGLTLGVAETITGGRMANRLSSAEARLRAGATLSEATPGDAALAGSDSDDQSNPSDSSRFVGEPGFLAGAVFAGGIVARSEYLAEYLIQAGSSEASPPADGDPSAASVASAPPLASAPGAQALARAARLRTGASVGLAVTAVDNSASVPQQHPNGTAFLAVSMAAPESNDSTGTATERELTEEVHLPGDRERLADYSAISALNLLRLMLAGRR